MAPKNDPQIAMDEVIVDDADLLSALRAREDMKEKVSAYRFLDKRVKQLIPLDDEYVGHKVRCGEFTWLVIDDPGGKEVSGYETKAGKKVRKLRAEG
jgi:hypothetical protein